MGAVNFSIDRSLVNVLKEAIPLDVFVETGTFQGDTVELVRDCFPEIHTVELAPEYFEKAQARFAGQAHIDLIHGDSATILAKLAPKLCDRSALYYLDAHWCVADNTAGATSQCPLLDEIRAIGKLNATSLIIIDDARLFLASPPAPHEISQWPSFNEVLKTLRGTSDNHSVMVLNDNILFVPHVVEPVLKQYSHDQGVDWLAAMTVFSEHEQLWLDLTAKEKAIQTQATALADAQAELEAKEAVIQELKTAYDNSLAQLSRLESVNQQQGNDLSSCKQLLGASEATLEAVTLRLGERDKTIQILTDYGMHASVSGSTQTNLALVKGLEEKEAVIQELAKALDAYRAAFRIFGQLLRPANHIKATVAGLRNRFRAVIMPRLGNLYQHTPRSMCLPASYQKTITLSDTPKVSIITPSFKQARFIGRTADSVLSQNYPNLEYFVQDGNSQDGTVEVLNSYGNRLAGWESKPDDGQSQAINLGFARTSGKIMAWLNSDDILLPGAIHTIVEYFNRHPEIDVVYGNRLLINEDDMQIGRWILPGHSGPVLSWADYVPQETLFWRRSIWERVGGKIDESFRFAMDWDLLVRFRDAGARFAHIPRFLGAFRIHEHQKTSAVISEIGNQEMDRIRGRLLGSVPTRTDIGKAVFPFMLKHVAVDISYQVRTRFGGKK